MKIRPQPFALLFTGLLLGFLIILQSRSFLNVQDIYSRDSRANVFHEIQILKRTNENLQEEMEELQNQFTKASDQAQALRLIEQQIKKNQILAGYTDITGLGIEIEIDKPLNAIWLVDIINELWSGGAEAVSINKMRLTDATIGFDTLPNGQISLNGVILNAPYTIQSIGDKKVLTDSLIQQEGVFERLKKETGIEVQLTPKEVVRMEKVL